MADIRIDREGKWYYLDMEMSRRDIITLFYRHLIRDDSGRFFIELGNQRCQVEIEDTAYVVWAVCARGNEAAEGGIYLLLSDESIEEMDCTTLRITEHNIPYCRVKSGRFDARFSSSSYYQLADFIRHDSQRDEYFVLVKGQRYYLPKT